MIETFDEYELPIRQLYELTNNISDYELFMNKCRSLFVLDRSMSDSNYMRFQVNDQIALLVGVSTFKQNSHKKVISCAILSICWWDTYSEKDHETQEEYEEERERFESIYNQILKLTIEEIGKPYLHGKDDGQRAYNYAIWKRESGLLILQQSSYDSQFGHDINYWIHPWEASKEIKPMVPFIDWLLKNTSIKKDN